MWMLPLYLHINQKSVDDDDPLSLILNILSRKKYILSYLELGKILSVNFLTSTCSDKGDYSPKRATKGTLLLIHHS